MTSEDDGLSLSEMSLLTPLRHSFSKNETPIVSRKGDRVSSCFDLIDTEIFEKV